jgi:hypothetical protein
MAKVSDNRRGNPECFSFGQFPMNVPSFKIIETGQTTAAVCLADWESQRLGGVLREFLTSRNWRREHWPGGTKRRVLLFEPIS